MQTIKHKGPAREHGQRVRFVPENLPALTDDAKIAIVTRWDMGTPMLRISRSMALSVPQVEAVLWEHHTRRPRQASVVAMPMRRAA